MAIGGHQLPNRGATDDWLTPPKIVQSLGTFDLDPCCPADMPWRTAGTMVHYPADGLKIPWEGRVWLNPPYGPETDRWLQRLALHGRGTALIFARTETKHWFEHVWSRASAVLFIKGRLFFCFPDGTRAKSNSGAPSALIAYGEEDAAYLKRASVRAIAGKFISLA